jgi:hypothetical protein
VVHAIGDVVVVVVFIVVVGVVVVLVEVLADGLVLKGGVNVVVAIIYIFKLN